MHRAHLVRQIVVVDEFSPFLHTIIDGVFRNFFKLCLLSQCAVTGFEFAGLFRSWCW